jgi:hypothetical protein
MSSVSVGQARDEVQACASINENVRRLECYDKFFRTDETKKDEKQDREKIVSFVDFITDFDDYLRKKVSVRGFGLMLGENLIVYKEMGDMNGIFVNIDHVSRENKREIYGRCGSGCNLVVSGIASKVMMQKGLVAQYVSVGN